MRFDRALRGWGGGRGSARKLAESLGVPDSTITRLLKGQRKASPSLALLIEAATDGAVPAESVPMTPRSRKQLRAVKKTVAGKEAA